MLAILTTHPVQYQAPLWQALQREGSVPFEVWYLSRHGIQPSPDVEFKKSFAWDLPLLEGYPYEFLKTNPNPKIHRFWGVRLQEDLRKRFREKKVKAIWIQGWQVFAYWRAVWEAHESGIEIWLRGESNDLGPNPFWKRIPKEILLRKFFQKIDRFLYIGEANRRLYEKLGVPCERLHSAPYGVDNERFARQAGELLPQRAAIRREWNIPEEAFSILFAGKFIPKKRPLDLVQSVCNGRVKDSEQPIHLLFAGSGELGKKLRESCRIVFDAEFPLTLPSSPLRQRRIFEERGQAPFQGWGGEGDSPRASFTGFLNQTEISKAYVAADCLVLPSDFRETWGLVVNEAMASGLPCIASDACGSAEDLVLPLNSRFRFRKGDTNDLAEAIRFLMENPLSRDALRAQAAKFGIEPSIQTVLKLYSENFTRG